MKKVLWSIIVLTSLLFYGACSKYSRPAKNEEPSNNSIQFTQNAVIKKSSDEMGLVFNANIEIDIDTAEEYCDFVLKEYQKQGYFKDYYRVSTKEYTIDGIPTWVCIYKPDEQGLTSEVIIAIKKESFDLVGMWINE